MTILLILLWLVLLGTLLAVRLVRYAGDGATDRLPAPPRVPHDLEALEQYLSRLEERGV